jgi:hypothetical protein
MTVLTGLTESSNLVGNPNAVALRTQSQDASWALFMEIKKLMQPQHAVLGPLPLSNPAMSACQFEVSKSGSSRQRCVHSCHALIASSLAKALFILSPSFLDINELPPWCRASPQPIVKVDPLMVRYVERGELEPLCEPQIIHSL